MLPRAIQASSLVRVIPDGGSLSYRTSFGWTAQLLVQLTLWDGRGLLDPALANKAAFRDAWFVAGGPPRPGVVPITPAARALCGLPAASPDGQPDTLVNAPGLRFLTSWPSARTSPP